MRLPVSQFLGYLVLTSLLSLPITSHASSSEKQHNILVVGDSLSTAFGIERNDGWVALLQQHLDKNGHPYHVVNASVSGETTRGGLARLPKALTDHKPSIVIIALGGNDGLRGLSLKEFRSNLEQMVQLSQQANAKVVLCGVRVPPNMGVAYINRFLQIYHETAQKYNVQFVNYILKDVATKPELMQKDGIHPKATAQPIILNNVLEGLQILL